MIQINVTKKCTFCKEGFPRTLDYFYGDDRATDGLRPRCKQCMRELEAVIRATPERKEYMRDYVKNNPEKFKKIIYRYMKKYPERAKAGWELKGAVRSGAVKKPKFCSVCGKGGLIHGHHEDYSKPYAVIWVCPQCHKNIHKRKKLSARRIKYNRL